MSEQPRAAEVDIDPIETQEWLDAISSVIREDGASRGQFILKKLADELKIPFDQGQGCNTPYTNTLPANKDPDAAQFEIANKLEALVRWNAVMIVLRAGKKAAELGGHIATFQSAATLMEMGLNYFYRARNKEFLGDLIFWQGHASPGIYARAFLEGRLTEEQLDNFRQEVVGKGLSSYPHPWLMPDFWQFPTVSMGLGPLQAIYQARFLKYLQQRKLLPVDDRKVWIFCGDGEMDEPESIGGLSIAAREKLDNLIFIINCNLQRLDGPVRGNGKIIQELESNFVGAGWHVIKVIWSSEWDELIAEDHQGLLRERMMQCVDGEYQNYAANDGAYFREHFFGTSPELLAMVEHLTDDELKALQRGGHDPRKVYAAYKAAMATEDKPVVILAKTVKGFGMGDAGEAQNNTHQQKKMNEKQLASFAQRFSIPVDQNNISDLPYIKPDNDSPEMQFLVEQREQLGGTMPQREAVAPKLDVPVLDHFSVLLEDSGDREISTTMAFVRMLSLLLRDKTLKPFIVPIVPDECRTFGMEGLFRQIGIYSPEGQKYEPIDKGQVMYYREAKDGQLMEEGLNEAGAFCTWMAAATSYANHAQPMIPFYIYYSMFGFQRIGDFAWAAGDMRARGFLLGATAGRTTLAGEGLQHCDGHSHILANVIPNCVSYDPCYSYEVAVIIQDGLRRMLEEQEDVFYYLTVTNENYHHPKMPEKINEGIVKGMYLLHGADTTRDGLFVNLLGSGTILREVIEAATLLKEFGIAANVWSVTSFTELRRDGLAIARRNLLDPQSKRQSYVEQLLTDHQGPVIAASDYLRLHADQIREYVPHAYHTLGTDGFGLSDTRKALRHHFEVDAKAIAAASIGALVQEDKLTADQAKDYFGKLGVDPEKSFSLNMGRSS